MESNNDTKYFLCEHYCYRTGMTNCKLYTQFNLEDMKEYLNHLRINLNISTTCYECVFSDEIEDIETRLLFIVD